ncbi:helix-turn-helix transcriptional regulator [Desulfovibrio cuneatus]|uniref:helix-turn-helix transcriptional regulator n=1 Tax=Desulfovibrio cuneatus TaxID=159728 RepID=UPI0004146438|nr:AlpA family phage regulatory protein [Desulfovibrio cuneatus]
MPQEGFVRLPQVLHVLSISASAWWNGVKTGKYPQSVKLGPRTTVWKVEEIRALIRQTEAQGKA